MKILSIILLLALSLGAQVPANQRAVSLPAFTPFQFPSAPQAAGLWVMVGTGQIVINNAPIFIPSQRLAMAASTRNYIYIDMVTGVVSTNTTSFPSSVYPIATADTNATMVITLIDVRPDVFVGIGGGSGGSGITTTTVGGLASIPGKTKGTIANVTDGQNVLDCSAGGGSTTTTCLYNNSTWLSLGSAITSVGTTGQVPVVNSGATAYSPQTKPVIDARDYGVTGNGITDDTTAMQAAVTAACPVGGKGSALILPNSFQIKLTSTLIASKCSGFSLATQSPQGQATIPSGTAAFLWYGLAGGTVLEINQVRDSDFSHFTVDTEASNHSAVGANTAILIDEIGAVSNIVTNNHFEDIGIYNAFPNPNFLGINICPSAPGNCEAQNFDRLTLTCRADFTVPTATNSGTGIAWQGGQPNYAYIHWIYGSYCSTAIIQGGQVFEVDGGLMNGNYTDLKLTGGIAISYKNIESQLSVSQIVISGSPVDVKIEDDIFSGLTNSTTTIGYSGTSGVKYTVRHNTWDANNTVTPIGPISSGVLNGDLVSENNRYPGSICPNTSSLGTWSSIGDSCTSAPFNNTLTLGGPAVSLLTPFSHTESYMPLTAVGATFSTHIGAAYYPQQYDWSSNVSFSSSNTWILDDVTKHGWDIAQVASGSPAISFNHFSPMANPNTSITTPFSILPSGFQVNGSAPSGHCLIGNGTVYADSTACGTPNWGAPGAAIGNVTPVPGTSVFTGFTAAGAVDFSGSIISKLRVAAGLTTTVNGDVGYDSTNANWHFWAGADSLMVPLASGFVSGDCSQPTLVSGKWTLVDAGGACSTGGSSGLSGMTTGQVPIAATSTTITSSKALAGSGTGITTGPVSGVTSLDVMESTGTGGQIADSSVAVANLVTAASNYTSGDLVQAAGANKTTSDSSIATANVVTSASNFTSGHIPKAAASNKTLADGYPVTGTDTNLLSSGTVSGTSVLLCTDANGGATTSGCPSTGGNVSTSGTITSGQIAIWASTTTIKSAAISGDSTMTSAGVMTNTGMNGVSLAGLATGILKNTTSTGVPSIAVSADTIAQWTGTCNSSTFLRADGSCQVPSSTGGTVNVALQYAMPYYCAAGSTNTICGTPAPTTPNGIAQTWTSTPSGGAATQGVWSIPGVPIDAQTGTSYTIPITDDVTFVTGNNASATAWTGFTLANNYAFSFMNINTGLITFTPASGTVNGNATQIIPSKWFGFHYTDNTNTFMPVMPTISAFTDCHGATNAVIFTASTGAFGCNTISGGGSGLSGMTAGQVPIAATATTVTSSEALAGSGAGITTGPVSGVTTLDLTEFTGAGGQITDSGILAANVVTQTSNATSGQVCTYTGSNKVCVPATALPNGVTATTQTATDTSADVATDAFVATSITNAIAAVNPAVAVLAASTTSLTGTYSNGAGGIGATFTVTATGAFTLDGISIGTIGQRVLLKNQSSAFQNGIYTATVVGATAISPVFTRALDYDQPSDMNNTGSIPVQSGTVNGATSWLQTSTVNTVGTDAVTFTQFSVNPSTLAPLASPTFTGNPAAPTQANCDNSTKLATTAFMNTPCTNIESSGSPLTLTGNSGYYYNDTASAYTFQLDAPVLGKQYCFGNRKARSSAVTVKSTTSVTIYYKGVAGTVTTGTLVSGGAAGDFICLVGTDTTTYEVTGAGLGTWTNN